MHVNRYRLLSSLIKLLNFSRQINLIHDLFSDLSRFSDSRAPAKERVFIWKIGLLEGHAKSSPTFVEVLHILLVFHRLLEPWERRQTIIYCNCNYVTCYHVR